MLDFVTALSFYLVQFQLVWIPLNCMPSVVTKAWGHRKGCGWWIGESVSNLCVGVEERSLRSHLFVVIYGQELLSILKHTCLCMCVLPSTSVGCPGPSEGVQHPWSTNHLLGMVGKLKNSFY